MLFNILTNECIRALTNQSRPRNAGCLGERRTPHFNSRQWGIWTWHRAHHREDLSSLLKKWKEEESPQELGNWRTIVVVDVRVHGFEEKSEHPSRISSKVGWSQASLHTFAWNNLWVAYVTRHSAMSWNSIYVIVNDGFGFRDWKHAEMYSKGKTLCVRRPGLALHRTDSSLYCFDL